MDGRPLFDPRTRAALLLLGFASGLPADLLQGTLQTRLAQAGRDPQEIGWLSLITLPAMAKALWAPAVDRWAPLGLGRRRSWMLLALAVLAPALLAMGACGADSLAVLIAAGTCAALASATLDLAVNGYTCDAVDARSAAAGAGLSVWGYRAAALVSSLGALWLAERHGWALSYAAMAAAVVLCAVPVVLAREPARSAQAPATLADALAAPVRAFLSELGPARLLAVLAFALLFRLADSWAANQTGAFLVVAGFTGTDIGLARGPVALVAAGLGVLVAGHVGARWSMGRCLFAAGLLGAASNLVFAALDQGVLSGRAGLFAAVGIEAYCGGFLSAVFVGFLVRLCGSSCAATQYALLTAVWLLGRYLTAPAGLLVRSQGWDAFFAWSALAGLPGLLLIPAVLRRPPPPPTTHLPPST